MDYQFPRDVEDLVAEQIRQGTYNSKDDVLRDALRALAERNANLAAIRGGIDDMEAGRLISLRDADAEIRKKFGFKPSR